MDTIKKRIEAMGKRNAKYTELLNLMDSDVAPLKYSVSPYENARKKMMTSMEHQKQVLERSMKIIKNLPIGEMLYIRASLSVDRDTLGNTAGTHEIDLVVTPITINNDSIRCILWTQERKSWETRQIDRGVGTGMRPIRLKHIIKWEKWEKRHAAFTVNHAYQANAYKRLAYGCE